MKVPEDPVLTQTQLLMAHSQEEDRGVHARLVSLTNPGFSYEFRRDVSTAGDHATGSIYGVFIGRHPDCQVRLEDRRVSAYHLRIYRDEAFRYFLEVCGANVCYMNENSMKRGETRALQHGDAISIGVYAHYAGECKPFAAYVFRIADQEGGGGGMLGRSAKFVSSVADVRHERQKLVTNQWLGENWDIRVKIGGGHFSEVRLGVRVQDGLKRAIKVIDKMKFMQFQKKRESHLCLCSEAEVISSLSHPGIVQCFEWFETENFLYLVMELIEGGDLLHCILEQNRFTEEQARRLFVVLVETVRYLHDEKGIVHRDLKPENVLLTSRDRESMSPKLADFGLATQNFQSRDCKTFCGTPHYFAPEVIRTFLDRDCDFSEIGYGKKVDMWSLGVMLYVMICGRPPFEDEGLYEQILEGRYEFDNCEWAKVSLDAMDLIRGLMIVNPRDRLAAEDVLAHAWVCFGVQVFSLSEQSQSERGRVRKAWVQVTSAAKRLCVND